jgi:hypothetical protein
MAIKEKSGKITYWVDGEGARWPLKAVSKADQKRDEVVESLVASALKLQMIIKQVKRAMNAQIQEYLNEVAESYWEHWQGNAKIKNFSQDKEVEVNIAKQLSFDETLHVAKVKIDKCITQWAEGSKAEIIALVNQAFQVNQKGQMDVKALLKLPRIQSSNPMCEAMEIIQERGDGAEHEANLNFLVKRETVVGRPWC